MHRNLMAVSLPVIGIVAGSPPALAARSAPARPDTAEGRVTWGPLQDHSGKAVDDRRAFGALRIAAEISAPGGLGGWTLAVDPATRAAHPGFGPLCQHHFTEPVTRAEVRCDWDTEHRPGGEPSANQGYVVRITADGGGSSLRDGTRPVTVSNPASAPESLRVDRADGRVRLTWAAAREPDAAGYTVSRQKGDESWRPVAAPETPAWEGAFDEPGRFRFRIGTRRHDESSATPRNWSTSEELVVADPDPSSGRPSRGGRSASPRRSSGTDEPDRGAKPAPPPAPATRDPGPDPPPPDSPGASPPPSPAAAPPASDADPAPDGTQAPHTDPAPQGALDRQDALARQDAPAPRDDPAPQHGPAPAPRVGQSTVWTVALSPTPAGQPRSAAVRAPSARRRRPAAGAAAGTAGSGAPAEPSAAGRGEGSGDADDRFSLDLPYAPPPPTAGPPTREDPAAGEGPPPSGPSAAGRDSGAEEALTAAHGRGDERRGTLAALAFGQVCFMLSLQGRYLLHRAGAHRFGRGARRTVHRCPSCRARLSEPTQPA